MILKKTTQTIDTLIATGEGGATRNAALKIIGARRQLEQILFTVGYDWWPCGYNEVAPTELGHWHNMLSIAAYSPPLEGLGEVGSVIK